MFMEVLAFHQRQTVTPTFCHSWEEAITPFLTGFSSYEIIVSFLITEGESTTRHSSFYCDGLSLDFVLVRTFAGNLLLMSC